MSRLTGNDALGLFEAYQAVYVPQEITEEQVWEEVENWVNSLVEEGYDLSDYTWEEMYESYLRESSHLKEFFGPGMEKAKKGTEANQRAQPKKGSTNDQGKFYTGKKYGYQSWDTATAKRLLPSEVLGSEKPNKKPGAALEKPALKPSGGSPARSALKPSGGSPARSAGGTPLSTSKPAASAQTGDKAKDMATWAKANPRLAQAQQIRQQGGSRAEVNKALYNKGTAAATSTPTVVKSGFDLFDVIKGHLLDEGYADTEEAAFAIMANMSEEWREKIVEETKRTEYLQKKFNKQNQKKSGSAHTYIPGKQNTGQALYKARESEKQMRGER